MKQLFFLATLLVYLQLTACSEVQETGQVSEAVLVSNVSVKEPADLVWPWLDSANSRWFFFNSATRPFGMVNLSPDTELEGAWGSGYRYETEHVKVLSHVHAWQLSGLPLLPVSTESSLPEIRKDHGSTFSHETEIVKPGYHRLWLDRYGIEVELTATTRTGFHRYHFGDEKPRQVLIPLQGNLGPGAIGAASIRQVGPRELEGHMVNEPTVRRPRRASLYFVLRFNADISGLDSWEGEEFAKNVREVAGDGIGGLVLEETSKQHCRIGTLTA